MARIERFEDIEAWQKARELTRRVYEMTREGAFAGDFGLRDQIRRAAVSIMSNIAEGFERGSNKEFIQYLFIAKGSAGEVRAQLYVAKDQGFLNDEQFLNLYNMAQQISRQISAFIKYLQNSESKGAKR